MMRVQGVRKESEKRKGEEIASSHREQQDAQMYLLAGRRSIWMTYVRTTIHRTSHWPDSPFGSAVEHRSVVMMSFVLTVYSGPRSYERLASLGVKDLPGPPFYKLGPEKTINTSDIITTKRVRKQRHDDFISIASKNLLSGFNRGFQHALSFASSLSKLLGVLPDPPEYWQQMLHHPHSSGFVPATSKEYTHINEIGFNVSHEDYCRTTGL